MSDQEGFFDLVLGQSEPGLLLSRQWKTCDEVEVHAYLSWAEGRQWMPAVIVDDEPTYGPIPLYLVRLVNKHEPEAVTPTGALSLEDFMDSVGAPPKAEPERISLAAFVAFEDMIRAPQLTGKTGR